MKHRATYEDMKIQAKAAGRQAAESDDHRNEVVRAFARNVRMAHETWDDDLASGVSSHLNHLTEKAFDHQCDVLGKPHE